MRDIWPSGQACTWPPSAAVRQWMIARGAADMDDCRLGLIELRRGLRGEIELLDSPPGLLAYRRGEHAVAINVGDREVRTPVSGEVVLATEPTDGAALRPGGAVVLRRTGA